MPSGRTHDSITLWSLPLIAGVTFTHTQNAHQTLLLSGGYLFSGLMFGPDLDIHSQQYKRWGMFRWIWLPYRRSMRHRSFLSHGFLVGTLIRIVYLFSWVVLSLGGIVLLSAIAHHMTGETAAWTQFSQHYWNIGQSWLGRSLQQHALEWLALFVGLELGALSHSLSDWISTRYKRLTPRKPTKVTKPKQLPVTPPASPPPIVDQTVKLPPIPRDSQFK
ncbi:MAG: metal-binding protein [Leptolyngbyaceae cyanobacterium bins.349]|nr:metal-binding protein [Leptolyngbyaceae cyanobacterium bins.349]